MQTYAPVTPYVNRRNFLSFQSSTACGVAWPEAILFVVCQHPRILLRKTNQSPDKMDITKIKTYHFLTLTK
jgi:hypothetical protein